jgi:hypothetical protein
MILKITNILKGFLYFLTGGNAKLSKNRMDICKRCAHYNFRHGEVFKKTFFGSLTFNIVFGAFCDLCGCFLKAKTRVRGENCPQDFPKWKNE